MDLLLKEIQHSQNIYIYHLQNWLLEHLLGGTSAIQAQPSILHGELSSPWQYISQAMVCFQAALRIQASLCVRADESHESISILGYIFEFCRVCKYLSHLPSIWKHFQVSGNPGTNSFFKLFQWHKACCLSSRVVHPFCNNNLLLLLANKIPYLAKREVSAVQPRRMLVFKPCRPGHGHKKHRAWPEHSSLLHLEAGPLLLNSTELCNVGTQNLNYLSRRLDINYRGKPGQLYS